MIGALTVATVAALALALVLWHRVEKLTKDVGDIERDSLDDHADLCRRVRALEDMHDAD